MITSILDKSAGFFSVFFFTLNHYIFCKKNKVSFEIDSNEWLFKYKYGWTDYFKECELKYDTNFIHHRLKHCQTADNFALHEYIKIIEEIYIYNDNVSNEIEKVKTELNLQKGTYDSIFIRRGDKLISESVYIHIKSYIVLLLKYNPNCNTIFIQTDDYRAYLELKEYINNHQLNIKVITLCDPNLQGIVVFDPKHREQLHTTTKLVTEKTPDEIYKHTLDMLIGIDILRNSNICVCDYQSNVSRFIKLSHNNPSNVYDAMYFTEIDYNRIECPAFGIFRGEMTILPPINI